MKERNARIESTYLGEDHGVFSFYLFVDYAGACQQGAGGIVLDEPVHDGDRVFKGRRLTAKGAELIPQILKVVGVTKWEDLPGKYIRVRADFVHISAIGNILKDEWLDFDNYFETGEPNVH